MKKLLYILAAIAILLIVTNPGYGSFTRFLGTQKNKMVNRKANLLVCSIYSADKKNYFAIFNGFYEISRYNGRAAVNDSLKRPDSLTTESPLKTAD